MKRLNILLMALLPLTATVAQETVSCRLAKWSLSVSIAKMK